MLFTNLIFVVVSVITNEQLKDRAPWNDAQECFTLKGMPN